MCFDTFAQLASFAVCSAIRLFQAFCQLDVSCNRGMAKKVWKKCTSKNNISHINNSMKMNKIVLWSAGMIFSMDQLIHSSSPFLPVVVLSRSVWAMWEVEQKIRDHPTTKKKIIDFYWYWITDTTYVKLRTYKEVKGLSRNSYIQVFTFFGIAGHTHLTRWCQDFLTPTR